MHSFPCLFRSSSISETASPMARVHWSWVQPVSWNFSLIINSVTFSQTQAEQKPHSSPDPLSTILVYWKEARNFERRRNWRRSVPDSGNSEGGSRVSNGGTGTFRCVQKVVIPEIAF